MSTNSTQSTPEPTTSSFNGFGLAALLVGIAGLAVSWLPFIGLIGLLFAVVGIGLGIVGLALQKYRGRRVLAIVGTAVSGLALAVAAILPWITGAFFFFGWAQDNEVFERIDQRIEENMTQWESDWETEFGPDATDPDEMSTPTLAPEYTPGPTSSTEPMPTESVQN
ncbi:hypothetical protein EG850_07740 [Gulosibacter macacae]|uniref:DUF4190 domain-containing protein n=1 Tax=Gulosibacter macacae TaxID=2488791 RepID=A0A3P3VVQ9_9MICO|nr:hypothetical protein [Gulosibacter macacae]RRJ86534.1 hypothetical protein EG850_07740 [Gulosibacter macacae]